MTSAGVPIWAASTSLCNCHFLKHFHNYASITALIPKDD
jgi:hypothetical protein